MRWLKVRKHGEKNWRQSTQIKKKTRQKNNQENKQGTSINAWFWKWTRARREEKPICICDRVTTFCQNDGSILTHGGNLHRCCNDGQTDTKQIVPNSGPCSTTGKCPGRSQLQMVQVARSRNHQTQNAQRPQHRENCKAERSWSTSPRASSPQRAGGRPDRMPAKHDHWTGSTCAGWEACKKLNLSSGAENTTSESA